MNFRRTESKKYYSKRPNVEMMGDLELSRFDLEHLEFFSYESQGKFLWIDNQLFETISLTLFIIESVQVVTLE